MHDTYFDAVKVISILLCNSFWEVFGSQSALIIL